MRGFKSILRKNFDFFILFLIFKPISFDLRSIPESRAFNGFKINEKTRLVLFLMNSYAFTMR